MDVLLSYGLRAIQVALVGACLYMGYVGISPILSAVSIAKTTIPPAPPAPERDMAFDPFQVIATRNLFKSQAAEVVEAPEQEEIQETKLNLKLLGTAASEPPEFSVAVIENVDRRERMAFSIDEEVAPGAILKRVEPRRAIIENRGVREQLSMDDDNEENKRQSELQRRKELLREQQNARRRPSRSTPADRVRGPRAQPDTRGSRPKLRSVLQGARMMPYFGEDGRFAGVKLQRVKPGGPFDGIPEGTICTEINGVPMTGVQSLPQAVAQMNEEAACVKCRAPDGSEITRCL